MMLITPMKIGLLLLPFSAAAATYGDGGTSVLFRQLTIHSEDAADLLEDAGDLVAVNPHPAPGLSLLMRQLTVQTIAAADLLDDADDYDAAIVVESIAATDLLDDADDDDHDAATVVEDVDDLVSVNSNPLPGLAISTIEDADSNLSVSQLWPSLTIVAQQVNPNPPPGLAISAIEDADNNVSVSPFLPSLTISARQALTPSTTDVGSAQIFRPIAGGDIFKRRPGGHVDREFRLFRSADPDEWLIFATTVLGLLLLEFFALRRFANGGFSQNMLVLGFWVAVGVGYNGYFFTRYGADKGFDWFTGYVLEWLLSIDNLFVFHLVFKVYKTPQELIPKALFFGVIGAVFFKMLFFLFIGELIHMAHVFQWFFGALLVYSGIETAMSSDQEEDEDVEDTYGVRIFRFCLGDRLCETYEREESRLFVIEDGRTCATLLVLVVFCLECTDIVFAVDSVSAKVAQIPNQYIAYSSSVFAMFGLRSMFFIINDLVEAFDLLKYGICVILCFVGTQLVLADWVDLSSATVLFVILSVFTICIAGSVATKRWKSSPEDTASKAKEIRG